MVNDPKDPGGLTNFGISAKNHPGIDVRNLTVEQAKAIYKKEYWDVISGDALPLPLGVALFDFAVNSGTGRAVQFLQDILHVQRDGVLGAGTKSALALFLSRNSAYELAVDLTHRRTTFLVNICRKRPSSLKFLSGWMKRVHRLIAYLGKHAE